MLWKIFFLALDATHSHNIHIHLKTLPTLNINKFIQNISHINLILY